MGSAFCSAAGAVPQPATAEDERGQRTLWNWLSILVPSLPGTRTTGCSQRTLWEEQWGLGQQGLETKEDKGEGALALG